MAEPRDGFEVVAELTNRYWKTLVMHAGTAAAVGPGALLPAVTLPQAQLDIQQAIREAFYAGATFQASMQPITMSVERSTIFDTDGDGEPRLLIERIPRLEATLHLEGMNVQAAPSERVDLSALPLPQRNPYTELFAQEGLQLWCPFCHQYTPIPRPAGPASEAPRGGKAATS